MGQRREPAGDEEQAGEDRGMVVVKIQGILE